MINLRVMSTRRDLWWLSKISRTQPMFLFLTMDTKPLRNYKYLYQNRKSPKINHQPTMVPMLQRCQGRYSTGQEIDSHNFLCYSNLQAICFYLFHLFAQIKSFKSPIFAHPTFQIFIQLFSFYLQNIDAKIYYAIK